MRQVTIRGIPEEVEKAIDRDARKQKVSRTRIIVSLLEQATGARSGPRPEGRLFHDLDHLAGSWSEEDAGEFEAHLAAQRQTDEDLWK